LIHESAIHTPTSCLFSAPFDFLPQVVRDFQSHISTEFREIWNYDELPDHSTVVAWVPNPGQVFVIDEHVLVRFPALRVIVTPSTGHNHMNLEACSTRGVAVYSLLDDRKALERISASAEFTLLLLLNTMRRLDFAVGEVSSRSMRTREALLRGHELAGKRVGLVGLGRIGRRMQRYCTAFDALVTYCDPHVTDVTLPGVSLPELFETCDAVCLCCALTDETHGMINYDLLCRLPLGAAFVNTSRGEVVVEQDLVRVLDERSDLRVGLDVICGEVENRHGVSPLLPFHDSGQIVVTPHIAGATVESQEKAARAALGILKGVLDNNLSMTPKKQAM